MADRNFSICVSTDSTMMTGWLPGKIMKKRKRGNIQTADRRVWGEARCWIVLCAKRCPNLLLFMYRNCILTPHKKYWTLVIVDWVGRGWSTKDDDNRHIVILFICDSHNEGLCQRNNDSSPAIQAKSELPWTWKRQIRKILCMYEPYHWFCWFVK